MRWKYDYSDEFKKKLGKIDRGSRNIVFKRICKIIDDPYRGKPLSHDLSGKCPFDYRQRISSYDSEKEREIWKIQGYL